MNVRSEITLELVRDNLVFRFTVPSNTTHEVGQLVCQEILNGLKEMQRVQQENKKDS